MGSRQTTDPARAERVHRPGRRVRDFIGPATRAARPRRARPAARQALRTALVGNPSGAYEEL
jgi:hypothetical protein